jgi:hypothetical protein
MQDDPSVKDLLSDAANIPKKIGRTILEAKVPISGFKSLGQFFVRNWLSGLAAMFVLVVVGSYYLSQLKENRHFCYGRESYLYEPNQTTSGRRLEAALAISPLAQIASNFALNSKAGAWDHDFDLVAFLKQYAPEGNYGDGMGKARNAEHAGRILNYSFSQQYAKCVSDRSWMPLFVVIGHGILTYLLLLLLGSVFRRRA